MHIVSEAELLELNLLNVTYDRSTGKLNMWLLGIFDDNIFQNDQSQLSEKLD